MPPGNVETLASGTPDPYPGDPAGEKAKLVSRAPARVDGVGVTIAARTDAAAPTLDAGGAVRLDLEPANVGLLEHLTDGALGVTREHIGRYAAAPGEELGRGGIGRVYVAVDRHLGRDVAVKELLLESPADSSVQNTLPTLVRFLREARITGRLEHPNIVPVYELGRRTDGSLYYTMRVVKGRTLARALDDAASMGARLALLDHYIGLCQAIAYAHSRGVVHRDVKPENVMIGEFGETVVLDWGMAKVHGSDGHDVERDLAQLEQSATLGVDVTLDGSLCGTPTHMSPEQARGAVHDVDERSDVWALGVVLYTILTGRHPFVGETLGELIHAIRRGVHAPPRERDGEIPAELSAVVERALRPDPSARYPSAKELLHDMQAYRSGGRVAAYEYSSLDLLRRFLARHRAAVIASAFGLAVAMVLAVVSYTRLATARDEALRAQRRATSNELEARKSERSAKESLSLALVEKAEQALAGGDRTSAEVLASEALRLGERADARGLVLAAESGFRPEPLRGPALIPGCARYALASSGSVVACLRGDTVSLFRTDDGAPRGAPIRTGPLTGLVLSADGSVVAAAREDGVAALYRLQDPGGTRSSERAVGPVSNLALSANGLYAAAGNSSGSVVLWAVGSQKDEWRFDARQGVSAMSFTPDGETLVVGGERGALTLWDFRGGHTRALAGHTGTVSTLAFAQQGRYLASGAADRTIRFWNVRDAVPVSSPIVQTDAITSLDWSADGKLLASGSGDRSFHVVDLRNPDTSAEVRFHERPVDAMVFGKDGGSLVTISRDIGLQHWSLGSLKTPTLLAERGNVLAFAFAPGSRLVSAGVGPEGVGIFNVATGACETRLPAGIERVRTLAVSNDGTRLAFAGSAPRVIVWDSTERVPLRVLDGPKDEVRAVAFSHDGRWLASAGLDRTLRVVDAATFAPVAELAEQAPLQAAAFAPGTNALVVGDRDGAVGVWDVGRAERLRRFKAHDDWVLAVAVSPDGTRIASASADRRVRIWDVASGNLLLDLGGHEGKVLSVAFSPDGRLLASGSDDKSVRIWDALSGVERALLRGHGGAVRSVHFAPEGPLLASSGDDATIRLWRLPALTESAVELAQRMRARYGVELTGMRVVRNAPTHAE